MRRDWGGMLKAWLRFFRAVNLPTVPGDVLVGAAMASFSGKPANVLATSGEAASSPLVRIVLPLSAACLASIFLYLYGLADNDIVGAKKDEDRPIPKGEISLGAARLARGLCLFAALIVASLANLPPTWWMTAFALTLAIVIYNRTKWAVVMGVCRGLNVVCGGLIFCASLTSGEDAASPLADSPLADSPLLAVGVCALVWMLYFAAVTKYSEGEERDPAKRQFVGMLIGAIIYLQLGALLLAYQLSPTLLTRNLLLAGAGLLIALRLMKRFLPGVSAS